MEWFLESYNCFFLFFMQSHHNARKVADKQRLEAQEKENAVLAKFGVRSVRKKKTIKKTRNHFFKADTKFMLEATEQLLVCRRVLEVNQTHNFFFFQNFLQFSYVYGFYLAEKGGRERELFEYLQEGNWKKKNRKKNFNKFCLHKDVEKHTNDLSQNYEKDLKDIRNDTCFYQKKPPFFSTTFFLLADYAAFIEWKEKVSNLTRVCSKFVQNFSDGVKDGLTQQ